MQKQFSLKRAASKSKFLSAHRLMGIVASVLCIAGTMVAVSIDAAERKKGAPNQQSKAPTRQPNEDAQSFAERLARHFLSQELKPTEISRMISRQTSKELYDVQFFGTGAAKTRNWTVRVNVNMATCFLIPDDQLSFENAGESFGKLLKFTNAFPKSAFIEKANAAISKFQVSTVDAGAEPLWVCSAGTSSPPADVTVEIQCTLYSLEELPPVLGMMGASPDDLTRRMTLYVYDLNHTRFVRDLKEKALPGFVPWVLRGSYFRLAEGITSNSKAGISSSPSP